MKQVGIFILISCIIFCFGCGDNSKETADQSVKTSAEETFQEYDVAPQPVDGFEAIRANLKYPEEARKQGTEGRVVVSVRIDEKGAVTEATIAESVPGLDEAALNAIKKTSWKPAVNQGEPVSATVLVPVEFRLK
jgi:protein TonB